MQVYTNECYKAHLWILYLAKLQDKPLLPSYKIQSKPYLCNSYIFTRRRNKF